MNCPRCKTPIGPLVTPDGVVTCPGCGARLMTRAAMLRSQGGLKPGSPKGAGVSPAAADSSEDKASARDLPPDATLPATPAQMLALAGFEGAKAAAAAPSAAPPSPKRKAGKPVPAAAPPPAVGAPPASPPPVAPPASKTAAEAGVPVTPAPAAPAVSPPPVSLEHVLRELHVVRELQERILERLECSGAAGRDSSEDDEPEVSPIRVRRRKSVVLIDDDPASREAAVAELTQADIPVRAFPDGQAAVAAIAEEKPDVIALELGLAGSMEGRDVINMIKSTMEWVDIRIVLWTREPVQGQQEARQLHGADEVVLKSSGAPALVARVITLFRRAH